MYTPANLIAFVDYLLQQCVNFPIRGNSILDLIICTEFLLHNNVAECISFNTIDHSAVEFCLLKNIWVMCIM
jgi:hypothetical protein